MKDTPRAGGSLHGPSRGTIALQFTCLLLGWTMVVRAEHMRTHGFLLPECPYGSAGGTFHPKVLNARRGPLKDLFYLTFHTVHCTTSRTTSCRASP